MNETSAALSPSMGRASPVPNRQSTTTAYRRRGMRAKNSPRYFSLTAAQSVENFSARQSTATSSPASCRMRAATNPSPPLLPPPHTKSASPTPSLAIASETARASAAPARSISTAEGVPAPIAASSNRRICRLENEYFIRCSLLHTAARRRAPPLFQSSSAKNAFSASFAVS